MILPNVGFSGSWEDAIAKVDRQAEEMNRKADDLGAPVGLGTMNNEYKIKEHTCSILGRMLGRADVITHLEEDLPTTSRDGEEFRFAALSLSNWSFTAKRLLKEDRQRRVAMWNLDCVGLHGISETEHISETTHEESAFYDLDEDGETLRVLGAVTEGFSSKLVAALDANPSVKVVALGSPGGSVAEALAAGFAIRQRGLETTLWNNCYSACPLVFIAGTKRFIWSPYPELGFHKISRNKVAIPIDDLSYSRVRTYALMMGVDADALYDFMISAEPQAMHTPSMDDLCGAKIAQWVQRVCSID